MPLTVAEGQANVVGPCARRYPDVSANSCLRRPSCRGQGFVFTLPAAASGHALGVSASMRGGNTIVGAGAPRDRRDDQRCDANQRHAPTAGAPNRCRRHSRRFERNRPRDDDRYAGRGYGHLGRDAHANGSAPTRNLLYLVASSRIRVFDATGSEVTKSGTAFDSLPPTVVGATYDSANGLIYVSYQTSSGFVLAYDRSGKRAAARCRRDEFGRETLEILHSIRQTDCCISVPVRWHSMLREIKFSSRQHRVLIRSCVRSDEQRDHFRNDYVQCERDHPWKLSVHLAIYQRHL